MLGIGCALSSSGAMHSLVKVFPFWAVVFFYYGILMDIIGARRVE